MTVVRRHVSQVLNPFLLILLLCADLAFVLLHVFNQLAPSLSGEFNSLLSLRTDRGYPEVFQYIKEYWIVILLFAALWRTREGIYGAWALVFAYLLCDDALRIHETVGQDLAVYGNFAALLGLRARDLGELAVSVAAGSVLLSPVAFLYFRSSSDARNVSKDLIFLLGILAFFSVFFDMLHVAVQGLLPVKGLTIIEDGGEMVTMSVIASYAANLHRRPTGSDMSLWHLLTSVLRRK